MQGPGPPFLAPYAADAAAADLAAVLGLPNAYGLKPEGGILRPWLGPESGLLRAAALCRVIGPRGSDLLKGWGPNRIQGLKPSKFYSF